MAEVKREDENICCDAARMALSIPEILEHIMNYSTVKDLKNIRLVSKQWYDLAKKTWRKLSPVSLEQSHSKSLSKFMTFLNAKDSRDSAQIYGNFVLYFDVSKLQNGLFQSFLDTCTPHLTVLELYGCFFPNVAFLRNVLFKAFPNMTQLSYTSGIVKNISDRRKAEPGMCTEPEFGEQLNLRKLSFDETIRKCGITWMELLSHYPNLKVLNIGYTLHTAWTDEIFSTVRTIRRRDPNKLQLTTIKSRATKCDMHVVSPIYEEVLLNSGLKLEDLAICVCGNNAAALLKSVTSKQGKTLTKLELGRGDANHLDALKFFSTDGVLENLQELKLNSRIFTTLGFLKYTPNLERLSIAKFSGDDPSLILESAKLLELRDFKLLSCMELEIENIFTAKRLQLLMKWLPNMERVKIPLDNHTFEQVCRGWPNLTKLEMEPCDVDACGLTGLDPEQVEIINNGQDQNPTTVPRANITCLKYLRVLSMGAARTKICRPLGRCSFVYGFQQVPHLERVLIKGPPLWPYPSVVCLGVQIMAPAFGPHFAVFAERVRNIRHVPFFQTCEVEIVDTCTYNTNNNNQDSVRQQR